CWFFGDFGTMVHWDGKVLSDATPDTGKSPGLAVEYTGVDSRTLPDGTDVGIAVASSGDALGRPQVGVGLNLPPAQLFSSDGTTWTTSSYSPPTVPRPGDPYRTNLTAVSAASDGTGWTIGTPAGWSLSDWSIAKAGTRGTTETPEPALVLPINARGENESCVS